MDGNEFIRIIDPYARPLKQYIYHHSQNRDLADDITQEIFELAWEDPEKFLNRDNVAAYMKGIARNKLADIKHYEKRTANILELLKISHLEKLDEQNLDVILDILQRKDIKEILDHAIADLPPESNKIITLRFGRRHNMTHVAAILGLKYSTAMDRQTKALKLLRKSLEKQGIHSNDVTLRFLLFMVFRQ